MTLTLTDTHIHFIPSHWLTSYAQCLHSYRPLSILKRAQSVLWKGFSEASGLSEASWKAGMHPSYSSLQPALKILTLKCLFLTGNFCAFRNFESDTTQTRKTGPSNKVLRFFPSRCSRGRCGGHTPGELRGGPFEVCLVSPTKAGKEGKPRSSATPSQHRTPCSQQEWKVHWDHNRYKPFTKLARQKTTIFYSKERAEVYPTWQTPSGMTDKQTLLFYLI